MHLKILQQDLIGPLQSVTRSVGVKANLPVLSNILLQSKDSKLIISATNLEVGVIKVINATILEDGSITVPAKTLNEIVNSLSGLEIEFITESEILKIQAGKFKANLNCMSASEFPVIPIDQERTVHVPKEIFKETIPQISFATAVDEGRPVLTGVLTEIKENKLEVVATDGFRLAHKTYYQDELKDINFKALIPRKSLDELVRLINEEEAEVVNLSTTDNQNQVVFRIGSTILSSRLIEGNFPDWNKIIPKLFVSKTLLNKEELIKNLKLASVFARGEANVIRLIITNSMIKIISETKELGHQDAEISAEISGEDLEIAFNLRYLMDAVNACPGDQISIQFSGNLSPTLIKPTTEENLEYIVMPLKVN